MSEKKETPDELTKLQEENKKLQEENKKLTAELTKANEAQAKNVEIIKDLNDNLAEKEAENDSLAKYPVLTHKGKKYELVDAKSIARFEEDSVFINKESLEKNSALFDFCIAKGFSCLKLKGAN
jgi:cell division septum initiation protein DivIVA